MRILYWIPNLHTVGAEHWIYLGWKHGFEDSGHDFLELTAADHDWRRAIDQYRPDILFCQNLVDLERHAPDLLWAREYGVRVFLVVHWPMSANDVAIIRRNNLADIYFGEREPTSMTAFTEATGQPYVLIPNAADSRLHFPVPVEERYAYDIVYLGANLPAKRKLFDAILRPLMRRYRVGVFGPGWTWRDRALGAAGRAARRLSLPAVAGAVSRARVTIPADEERVLYSSAKLALNFHEQITGHVIVNQRTFKIAACGGVQICDDVPGLRKYFTSAELVIAGDPEDWQDMIEHYMAHPEERAVMRVEASERALRDHTYVNRVVQVIALTTPAVQVGTA